MTSDLERLLAGKRALRRKLQELPLGEKLRLLDAMRERALTLRRAAGVSSSVEEPPARYAAKRPSCPR